ncbi:hypothetical protein ACSQ67_022384 [Phaseolus vulgaris]
MNPIPFQSVAPPPPPPWFPILPSEPPNSASFWENRNVSDRLRELRHTLNLAKAMQKELEMLMVVKDGKGSLEGVKLVTNEPCHSGFLKCIEDRGVSVESLESFAVEAANSLMSKLRAQLEPFRYVADETSPWEEKSAVARLANKEHEKFEQMDREADDWIAREKAKEIANSKVLKMKEIAKSKAKEEKKKLEAELSMFLSSSPSNSFFFVFSFYFVILWLPCQRVHGLFLLELLLVVEKLQELRSIRIQRLKKQGHFLPEEDDKFLDRVQAAVEEEEREALAALEADAAKEAIATAEESRKAIQNQGKLSKGSNDDSEVKDNTEQIDPSVTEEGSGAFDENKSSKIGQISGGAYDPLANLPIEFYHYYYGSNNDMGTLIEPHTVALGSTLLLQPNEIWASYLVRPK